MLDKLPANSFYRLSPSSPRTNSVKHVMLLNKFAWLATSSCKPPGPSSLSSLLSRPWSFSSAHSYLGSSFGSMTLTKSSGVTGSSHGLEVTYCYYFASRSVSPCLFFSDCWDLYQGQVAEEGPFQPKQIWPLIASPTVLSPSA